MNSSRKCPSIFARDEGSVIIMVTFAMFLTIVAVGVAIDMVRAQTLHSRMQSALDAAGLAVSVSGNSCNTTACMNTLAQRYFNANFSANYLNSTDATTGGTIPTVSITKNSNGITLSTSSVQSTTFLKTFGMNTVNVGAATTVGGTASPCVGTCVYVTDSVQNKVDIFNGDGSFNSAFGQGALSQPTGIAVDANNDVWAVNTSGYTCTAKKFHFTGNSWSVQKTLTGIFPCGIAVDSSNNLWLSGGNTVKKYNSNGTAAFVNGTQTSFALRPGTIAVSGIAVDPANGNIWVTTANSITNPAGTSYLQEYLSNGQFVQQWTLDFASSSGPITSTTMMGALIASPVTGIEAAYMGTAGTGIAVAPDANGHNGVFLTNSVDGLSHWNSAGTAINYTAYYSSYEYDTVSTATLTQLGQTQGLLYIYVTYGSPSQPTGSMFGPGGAKIGPGGIAVDKDGSTWMTDPIDFNTGGYCGTPLANPMPLTVTALPGFLCKTDRNGSQTKFRLPGNAAFNPYGIAIVYNNGGIGSRSSYITQ